MQAVKLESLLFETSIPVAAPEENIIETEAEDAREEDGEKWVQAMEYVCQLLPKGLPFLMAKNGYGKSRGMHISKFTIIFF